MVKTAYESNPQELKEFEIPDEGLKWSSVPISEIQQKSNRLEASVFEIEGKKAHGIIENCKWPLEYLSGNSGISKAYLCPRFKRIFVESSGYPIFQPSQINEVYPKPHLYISEETPTNIDDLRVEKGQILLSRSGTIGNCAIVGEALNKAILSDDLIRITPNSKELSGYIYAFLKTKTGNTALKTNNYGAVVSHIEPEHLEEMQIPLPADEVVNKVSSHVNSSIRNIDRSNQLIDEAENLMMQSLNLPDFKDVEPDYFDSTFEIKNYSVRLSRLDNRLDASYHKPIVNKIADLISKNGDEVTKLEDNRISKNIILPGRFKRVYVEEGQGVPFVGGKQIFELDPSNKKFLSLYYHNDRIERELKLEENMVLVTRSGTIGRVNIVPKHWDNWIINEHVIRIVPKDKSVSGYIFTWLNSDFGKEMIKRFTYGAVVNEIDTNQLGEVPIPILKSKSLREEINNLVLKANQLRYEAYKEEQLAIETVNEKVFEQAPSESLTLAADPGENYKNNNGP